MPAWWHRLLASPRALVAVGVLVAAVVVATTITVATRGSGDEPTAAPSSGATPDRSEAATPAPAESTPSGEPPDRDEYCPAFRKIRSGGLAQPGDEDSDTVDLQSLSRTFDGLISRYDDAARVSPLSLRDDYAKALGYLREGQKAVDSGDVDLIKALVVNLDTLNASMDAIAKKSRSFCD